MKNTKQPKMSGISQVMQKLESMEKSIDARFETVDSRFEGMDKRFESMDKRFDGLEQRFVMDMSELRQVFTKRMDNMRTGIEEKITKLDAKVDRLDARDEIRFKQLQTATLQNSRFILDMEKTVNAIHEDVNIVKLKMDGVQKSYDDHDADIVALKKAVGIS